MRSESNWYEFGEKLSKYFQNLEKRNKARSHVRKIITENNSEISEPQEILLHIKEFISTLYKRHSTKGEEEYLEHLKTLTLFIPGFFGWCSTRGVFHLHPVTPLSFESND